METETILAVLLGCMIGISICGILSKIENPTLDKRKQELGLGKKFEYKETCPTCNGCGRHLYDGTKKHERCHTCKGIGKL